MPETKGIARQDSGRVAKAVLNSEPVTNNQGNVVKKE